MVSDELLIAELVVIKRQEPTFGVQKLSAKIHETQPNWQFNSKRIRSLLREINKTWEDQPIPSVSLSLPASPCSIEAREKAAEVQVPTPIDDTEVPTPSYDAADSPPLMVKVQATESDLMPIDVFDDSSFVQINDCASPQGGDLMENEEWVLIS